MNYLASFFPLFACFLFLTQSASSLHFNDGMGRRDLQDLFDTLRTRDGRYHLESRCGNDVIIATSFFELYESVATSDFYRFYTNFPSESRRSTMAEELLREPSYSDGRSFLDEEEMQELDRAIHWLRTLSSDFSDYWPQLIDDPPHFLETMMKTELLLLQDRLDMLNRRRRLDAHYSLPEPLPPTRRIELEPLSSSLRLRFNEGTGRRDLQVLFDTLSTTLGRESLDRRGGLLDVDTYFFEVYVSVATSDFYRYYLQVSYPRRRELMAEYLLYDAERYELEQIDVWDLKAASDWLFAIGHDYSPRRDYSKGWRELIVDPPRFVEVMMKTVLLCLKHRLLLSTQEPRAIEPSEPSSEPPPLPRSSSGSVRQELQTPEWLCRICCDRNIDAALQPCGHTGCHVCLSAMRDCAFCRRTPTGTLRLFF